MYFSISVFINCNLNHGDRDQTSEGSCTAQCCKHTYAHPHRHTPCSYLFILSPGQTLDQGLEQRLKCVINRFAHAHTPKLQLRPVSLTSDRPPWAQSHLNFKMKQSHLLSILGRAINTCPAADKYSNAVDPCVNASVSSAVNG